MSFRWFTLFHEHHVPLAIRAYSSNIKAAVTLLDSKIFQPCITYRKPGTKSSFLPLGISF